MGQGADLLVTTTIWKVRRRRCSCLLMAAATILLVVAHKARMNKVVKATDTMSATAGKTQIAHLQAKSTSILLWIDKSSSLEGEVKYGFIADAAARGKLTNYGH